MNELSKRVLSGTLYVALLSTTMLLSPLAFFVVIGVFFSPSVMGISTPH